VPSQDSERATTRSVSFGHAGPTDAAPYARNAILSLGDLVIGDNVEVDADISATGSVTIGRDASVLGSITTGGDLRMGPNAVVSDAACGGRIILGKGAEVTGRIEAVRGMGPESDRP
jgi:serine acetyltransferase